MNTKIALSSGLLILAMASVGAAQPLAVAGGFASFVVEQSYTSGMVGFTTGQTARLSVLNMNPVPASTSSNQPANCTVQLEFLDNKGATVSQTVVPNFAPGTATSFDLPRAGVTSETAAARAQIRGVVVVNPTPAPAGTPTAVGYCTVFTTLEIIDSTGSTISLTSDTRPVGVPNVTIVAPGGK